LLPPSRLRITLRDLAAIAVTAAAIVMLTTRLNPLWLLAAGGALDGFGLLV